MKIRLFLQSQHFSEEEAQRFIVNPIELDWELPFLPNKEDLIDLEEIKEDLPEEALGFSWSVDYINYTKVNGSITPELYLFGE